MSRAAREAQALSSMSGRQWPGAASETTPTSPRRGATRSSQVRGVGCGAPVRTVIHPACSEVDREGGRLAAVWSEPALPGRCLLGRRVVDPLSHPVSPAISLEVVVALAALVADEVVTGRVGLVDTRVAIVVGEVAASATAPRANRPEAHASHHTRT